DFLGELHLAQHLDEPRVLPPRLQDGPLVEPGYRGVALVVGPPRPLVPLVPVPQSVEDRPYPGWRGISLVSARQKVLQDSPCHLGGANARMDYRLMSAEEGLVGDGHGGVRLPLGVLVPPPGSVHEREA